MSCSLALELVRLKDVRQNSERAFTTTVGCEIELVDSTTGNIVATRETGTVPEQVGPFFHEKLNVDLTAAFLQQLDAADAAGAPPAAGGAAGMQGRLSGPFGPGTGITSMLPSALALRTPHPPAAEIVPPGGPGRRRATRASIAIPTPPAAARPTVAARSHSPCPGGAAGSEAPVMLPLTLRIRIFDHNVKPQKAIIGSGELHIDAGTQSRPKVVEATIRLLVPDELRAPDATALILGAATMAGGGDEDDDAFAGTALIRYTVRCSRPEPPAVDHDADVVLEEEPPINGATPVLPALAAALAALREIDAIGAGRVVPLGRRKSRSLAAGSFGRGGDGATDPGAGVADPARGGPSGGGSSGPFLPPQAATMMLWWHMLHDGPWRDRFSGAMVKAYTAKAQEALLVASGGAPMSARRQSVAAAARQSSRAMSQAAALQAAQADIDGTTLGRVAERDWAVRRSHQLLAKLRFSAERFMLGASGTQLLLGPEAELPSKVQWKGDAAMRRDGPAVSPTVAGIVEKLWVFYLCGDIDPVALTPLAQLPTAAELAAATGGPPLLVGSGAGSAQASGLDSMAGTVRGGLAQSVKDRIAQQQLEERQIHALMLGGGGGGGGEESEGLDLRGGAAGGAGGGPAWTPQAHHRAAMMRAVFARPQYEFLRAALLVLLIPSLKGSALPARVAAADYDHDDVANPPEIRAAAAAATAGSPASASPPSSPTTSAVPVSAAAPRLSTAAGAAPGGSAAGAAAPKKPLPAGQQALRLFSHILTSFAGALADGYSDAEMVEILKAAAPAVAQARERAQRLAAAEAAERAARRASLSGRSASPRGGGAGKDRKRKGAAKRGKSGGRKKGPPAGAAAEGPGSGDAAGKP